MENTTQPSTTQPANEYESIFPFPQGHFLTKKYPNKPLNILAPGAAILLTVGTFSALVASFNSSADEQESMDQSPAVTIVEPAQPRVITSTNDAITPEPSN